MFSDYFKISENQRNGPGKNLLRVHNSECTWLLIVVSIGSSLQQLQVVHFIPQLLFVFGFNTLISSYQIPREGTNPHLISLKISSPGMCAGNLVVGDVLCCRSLLLTRAISPCFSHCVRSFISVQFLAFSLA